MFARCSSPNNSQIVSCFQVVAEARHHSICLLLPRSQSTNRASPQGVFELHKYFSRYTKGRGSQTSFYIFTASPFPIRQLSLSSRSFRAPQLLLQVYEGPTFVKIYKKKAVEEFKPDPYIATAMNCMLWIFYGLPMVHPDSVLVVTINSIGLAMELIYLSIFFLYAPNKGRAKVIGWLALEILFLGVVAACTLTLRKTHAQRSDLVGILCVIFGVLMYASPLTIMRKVIKTKSVKYMPFYLSLANFLNGVIWVTYALIRFDLYILIGNGLGALSGAIQLILYACYFKSAPKDDDENDVVKPSELQLSGSNGPARPTV
ncbi:hypothetical protein E1A91_A05G390300v1 [Gossypium mustelinum]|uniref:Bidirectional sugar transporter SWEET n=2 Tax=Gossypium TaxID=3633 RepID=A0A5D2ZHR1_GOSMU|nr:hypothetical protein E1A91_A05G390300v1 [Gossypium mustelinum]